MRFSLAEAPRLRAHPDYEVLANREATKIAPPSVERQSRGGVPIRAGGKSDDGYCRATSIIRGLTICKIYIRAGIQRDMSERAQIGPVSVDRSDWSDVSIGTRPSSPVSTCWMHYQFCARLTTGYRPPLLSTPCRPVASLWLTVMRLSRPLGSPRVFHDRQEYERVLAVLRGAMASDRVARLMKAGAAMSEAEAFEQARADDC